MDPVGIEPTTSPAKPGCAIYTHGENLVDLVGIEPTTSSMPWCDKAAGPLFSTT